MKNKTKLNLLLSLCLCATPGMAQNNDTENQQRMERRAKNFADFLLYWTDWDAFTHVNMLQIKRAERNDVEDAKKDVEKLTRDSTYYADEITKRADIINKRYDLDEKPDMAFAKYELACAYKQKYPSKDAPEYILGKMLEEYEDVLKKLKLARYTIRHNKKEH